MSQFATLSRISACVTAFCLSAGIGLTADRNINADRYNTGIKLDPVTTAQAKQARVTSEEACAEQEKMSRGLQKYLDKIAADEAAHNKTPSQKNPDFVITKEECLHLVQERQQRATSKLTIGS